LKSYGLLSDTDLRIVEELKRKYNDKVKSGPISNEFAGAALRTGHSTIEGFIK